MISIASPLVLVVRVRVVPEIVNSLVEYRIPLTKTKTLLATTPDGIVISCDAPVPVAVAFQPPPPTAIHSTSVSVLFTARILPALPVKDG